VGESWEDAIFLLDTPDDVRKKIRRATTDSLREIQFDEKRPGINNLLTIYRLLTEEEPRAVEDHFAGKSYKNLKDELAELIVEKLKPLRERYNELTGEEGYLDQMLARGAERAEEYADKKMAQVMKHMGLR